MPLTVTIRSSSHGGAPSAGTPVSFTIAPVGASGNLVYWSPTGSTSGGMTVSGQTTLNGFAVGDETITQVLTCSGTQANCDIKSSGWETDDQGLNLRPVSCIGCHTSTPDGNFISFNDFYPWGGVLASGQPASIGAAPTFLGAGGYNAFIQPWVGITTYSQNHWTTATTSWSRRWGRPARDADQQPGLAWFDLESTTALPQGQNPFQVLKGTAWNWIYQPVAGHYAAAPSWSHAQGDDFVVFTMTSNVKSGTPGNRHRASLSGPLLEDRRPDADADPGRRLRCQRLRPVLRVAVGRRHAHRLRSDPAPPPRSAHADLNTTDHLHCNPALHLGGMYMQPAGRALRHPAVGRDGDAAGRQRSAGLRGQPASPGINNTWAKWSPEATAANGNTYYWVIFSSWRQGRPTRPASRWRSSS